MARQSRLHVPHARARPGEAPDFSDLEIPSPEDCPRPPVAAASREMEPLAFGLVRVLDDEGAAAGAWNPGLDSRDLQVGLRHMLLTRAFDERMHSVHRQGKISFYIRSTGEEAVAVAAAMALEPRDMLFPSYRTQGLQVARGRPLSELMCQCLSNTRDMCKGRQMPIMYHWREGNIFSVSGNLAAQVPHAVGWAMAAAVRGEDHIAAAWLGEGATAEPDFHHGLVFAAVYKAPVIINVVNNQWAISTTQGFAGGEISTFAARGLGLDIPGIRVDGNDLAAVFAVTRWAAERARKGLGPTLIEHLTYRAGPHSTSDDPSRYRPREEVAAWPLGDPIERLHRHLRLLGGWTDASRDELARSLRQQTIDSWKEAIGYGTLTEGPFLDRDAMFEDLFEQVPDHLRKQREILRRILADDSE